MRIALIAALALGMAAPAAATTTVFFGIDLAPTSGTPAGAPAAWAARAAFDAYFAGNVSTVDFESPCCTAVPPFGVETLVFTGAAGTVLSNFVTDGGVATYPLATSGAKTYANGDNGIHFGLFTKPTSTHFGTQQVNGAGLFFLSLDIPPPNMAVYLSGNTSVAFAPAFASQVTSGSIFFWGVASNSAHVRAFNTGLFPINNCGSCEYHFDDAVIGILPEPGALTLFGLGAIGLAARRPRR